MIGLMYLCATESDVFSPSAFLMHAQSDQALNLLYLGGKIYWIIHTKFEPN